MGINATLMEGFAICFAQTCEATRLFHVITFYLKRYAGQPVQRQALPSDEERVCSYLSTSYIKMEIPLFNLILPAFPHSPVHIFELQKPWLAANSRKQKCSPLLNVCIIWLTRVENKQGTLPWADVNAERWRSLGLRVGMVKALFKGTDAGMSLQA